MDYFHHDNFLTETYCHSIDENNENDGVMLSLINNAPIYNEENDFGTDVKLNPSELLTNSHQEDDLHLFSNGGYLDEVTYVDPINCTNNNFIIDELLNDELTPDILSSSATNSSDKSSISPIQAHSSPTLWTNYPNRYSVEQLSSSNATCLDFSCSTMSKYSRYNHSSSSTSNHHKYTFQHPIPQQGILNLTEEEKRTMQLEGLPIPHRLPLTKTEERNLKKVRRKIKNKLSAQESRRKKKEYMEALEKRVEYYVQENIEMKKRLDNQEALNKSLLNQLRYHQQTYKNLSHHPASHNQYSVTVPKSSHSSLLNGHIPITSNIASTALGNINKRNLSRGNSGGTTSLMTLVLCVYLLACIPLSPRKHIPPTQSHPSYSHQQHYQPSPLSSLLPLQHHPLLILLHTTNQHRQHLFHFKWSHSGQHIPPDIDRLSELFSGQSSTPRITTINSTSDCNYQHNHNHNQGHGHGHRGCPVDTIHLPPITNDQQTDNRLTDNHDHPSYPLASLVDLPLVPFARQSRLLGDELDDELIHNHDYDEWLPRASSCYDGDTTIATTRYPINNSLNTLEQAVTHPQLSQTLIIL